MTVLLNNILNFNLILDVSINYTFTVALWKISFSSDCDYGDLSVVIKREHKTSV